MNRVDHDPEFTSVDEYGNVTSHIEPMTVRCGECGFRDTCRGNCEDRTGKEK